MPAAMTSRQRISRVFDHQTPDRVPFWDTPWGPTVARWRREGLGENVDWRDHFDLDRVISINPDNTPRYPREVIEETDDYVIAKDQWGTTLKNWKHQASCPEHLGNTIIDPDAWAKARKRMRPTRDRVNWEHLEQHYPAATERGDWRMGVLWFGFDITHSRVVGTERTLMAMIEQPEWIMDMFETELDLSIALLEMVMDAGYELDCIDWPDDMGYKYNQFFSLDMYRELLKPFHKKAADWARSKGLRVRMHSCGDVRPFIGDLVKIGIECLNPLEVKAGVDPVQVKRQYGDKLVLHGGINALLMREYETVEAEMRRLIPQMKAGSGYIFATDHSIPSNCSFEEFGRIVDLYRELGSYE
jgi:uroporphyrinogen decarboxylase